MLGVFIIRLSYTAFKPILHKLCQGAMTSVVAKRVGAFLGHVIDSLTGPVTVAAALVFPAEYVNNLKMKHEIQLAVDRVLERERSQRDAVTIMRNGS